MKSKNTRKIFHYRIKQYMRAKMVSKSDHYRQLFFPVLRIQDPGSRSRSRILIFTYPSSWIQGSKSSGSRIRIRNTELFLCLSLRALERETLRTWRDRGIFYYLEFSGQSFSPDLSRLTAQLTKDSYRTGPPGYIG